MMNLLPNYSPNIYAHFGKTERIARVFRDMMVNWQPVAEAPGSFDHETGGR